MTNDKLAPPPSDESLIQAFIEEGAEYAEQAKITDNDKEYWRLVGQSQARTELNTMLEGNRQAREAYAADLGKRAEEAFSNIGKALGKFVREANERAEQRKGR